jgi:hypothetical protein
MRVLRVDPGRYTERANDEQPNRQLYENWIVPLAADCVVPLTAERWEYLPIYVTKIDYSVAVRNRDLGLLRCGIDMDSSSLPGRVSWVENIKWSLAVSPFYGKNKGGVIISLFEYISVRYVKPREWAAGVEVCYVL